MQPASTRVFSLQQPNGSSAHTIHFAPKLIDETRWINRREGEQLQLGGDPRLEADPVMKVNVERAPSRGGEEWAGPRKQ